MVLPTGVKYTELRSSKDTFSFNEKPFSENRHSISSAEYSDIQGSPTLAAKFFTVSARFAA
jgi:hypothetical protein